jgi:preprotein translocase subunit SecG
VLLQSGKGGGLAGIASGGQTTQILGARQAPDFLEKATWTLGSVFLVLCVLTTFVIPRDSAGNSILQQRADELPAAAPTQSAPEGAAPAPQGTPAPAPAQQAPAEAPAAE